MLFTLFLLLSIVIGTLPCVNFRVSTDHEKVVENVNTELENCTALMMPFTVHTNFIQNPV